jgi:hypothetical protein
MTIGNTVVTFSQPTARLVPESQASQVAAEPNISVKPLSSGLVCNYEVCMALFGSGLKVEPWIMSTNLAPYSCTNGKFWWQGEQFTHSATKCTGDDPAVFETRIATITFGGDGTACNTAEDILGKPCAGVHS